MAQWLMAKRLENPNVPRIQPLQILPRPPGDGTGNNNLRTARFLISRLGMESRLIAQRAFQFACRITRLCERLRRRGWTGRKIADQLFDCGTSIGANSAESQGG